MLLLLNSFLLPCEQVTLDQAQKNSTPHTHKRGIFIFVWTEAIRQAIQAHRWFWFCLLCSGMQTPEMLKGIWLCRHVAFTCTEAGAEPGLNPIFPRALRGSKVLSSTVTGTCLPTKTCVHGALLQQHSHLPWTPLTIHASHRFPDDSLQHSSSPHFHVIQYLALFCNSYLPQQPAERPLRFPLHFYLASITRMIFFSLRSICLTKQTRLCNNLLRSLSESHFLFIWYHFS